MLVHLKNIKDKYENLENLDDIDVWNNILLSRNATAHIYSESDYEEIKENILKEYIDAMEKLLQKLASEVI